MMAGNSGKKKILAILVALTLLFTFIFSVPVLADPIADNVQVHTDKSFTEAIYSNGATVKAIITLNDGQTETIPLSLKNETQRN